MTCKYSVKIQEKSITKSNQEKGTPLLGVLKATGFAGAIFTEQILVNRY
jgi:hypothetical protein